MPSIFSYINYLNFKAPVIDTCFISSFTAFSSYDFISSTEKYPKIEVNSDLHHHLPHHSMMIMNINLPLMLFLSYCITYF